MIHRSVDPYIRTFVVECVRHNELLSIPMALKIEKLNMPLSKLSHVAIVWNNYLDGKREMGSFPFLN